MFLVSNKHEKKLKYRNENTAFANCLAAFFCVFQVRDNATLVLSRVLHTQSFYQHQDNSEESMQHTHNCRYFLTWELGQPKGSLLSLNQLFCVLLILIENLLLEEDNTFHLVRPADDIDEVKSKRGSMKDKAMTKAITEIYLTRLLSVKVRVSIQEGRWFRK